MGNDTSTLKIANSTPDIIVEEKNYKRKPKRSISQARNLSENRIQTSTPPVTRKSSACVGASPPIGNNTLSVNTLQVNCERRRSRSLCGAQMEKDMQQAVAAMNPKPELSEQKSTGVRKGSSGLVPPLNRLRIQQAFKAAKPTMGEAIFRRAAAARPEIRSLLAKINEKSVEELSRQMYSLVSDAVQNADKSEEVLQHGRQFGETFASLCPLGFRPDLFSPLADAAIAECVKLDGGGMHKRCDTLMAWSQLIGAIFTSVRDGYYQRVRFQRRSSLPQHTVTKQLSIDLARLEHRNSKDSS